MKKSLKKIKVKSKYSDNEYACTMMCHEVKALPLIEKAIKWYNPELFVELGTFVGGFTLFLHECNTDIPLYTFDHSPMEALYRKGRVAGGEEHLIKFRKVAFNNNVSFIVDDLLSVENSMLVSVLQSPKRKFAYFDNGNKPKEINMYAKFLRSGDMLGVHDFGTEITLDSPGVEDSLNDFVEHSLNSEFRKQKLLTRLFIKK